MSAAEDLYRQALDLPEDERRELAKRLLETVDTDIDPEIAAMGVPPGILCLDDPGLAEELRRRVAEIDAGAPTIPAEQLFADLRARRVRDATR